MSTETNSHKVAWADRLGLNRIWHDAIQACSFSYGTEDYRRNVLRLYHLLVDIRDGPQLKTMATKYKNGSWEEKIKDKLDRWKRANIDLSEELSIIQDEEEKIRDDVMEDFFDYMLQLLETTGYGFYKSDYSTDDISLTNKATIDEEDSTEEIF